MTSEAGSGPAAVRADWADLAAIPVCTLVWGTTWYAITLQFGVVDPVVSVVYRFALAGALLFVWCLLRREPLGLTWPQHAAALGLGFFTFTMNYTLVYWAEERVTSAVVAVIYAAQAFISLVIFRIAFGERAAWGAWLAATLGIGGVVLLSWEEIGGAAFGARAAFGVALTLAGVVAATIGNVYARRGELVNAPVSALTGWAMLYGAGATAMFAFATGKAWAFEPSWTYVLSLLHLSVLGSVVAFLTYFTLARRRGYALAAYVSALTPPVAMLVSSVMEAKSWGGLALGGVCLVLAGQYLLLRTKRA